MNNLNLIKIPILRQKLILLSDKNLDNISKADVVSGEI